MEEEKDVIEELDDDSNIDSLVEEETPTGDYMPDEINTSAKSQGYKSIVAKRKEYQEEGAKLNRRKQPTRNRLNNKSQEDKDSNDQNDNNIKDKKTGLENKKNTETPKKTPDTPKKIDVKPKTPTKPSTKSPLGKLSALKGGAKNLDAKNLMLTIIKMNPVIIFCIFGILFLVLALFVVLATVLGSEANNTDSSSGGGTSYRLKSKGFDIHKTTLTEEEFVSKMEAYNYPGENTNAWNIFVENAETIYELGTSNNVNPELIVIRAYVEGFSPSHISAYSDKNNYWGIGCTNGASLSACESYSSFSDGVLGFINIVKDYTDLIDMMSHYAYIGRYWYNPGDAGQGGCYYYQYIKKYLSDKRAEEIQPYCESGNECSGSSCLETNNEDQSAYALYQAESMSKFRKDIFGLEPNGSNETYAFGDLPDTCKIFNQGDPTWSGDQLGFGGDTIGSAGCAMSSVAMGITCYGNLTEEASNFNPGVFNSALQSVGAYTGSCIYWDGFGAIQKYAPNIKFYTYDTIPSYSYQELQAFLSTLPERSFVVIQVRYGAHYVLLIGADEKTGKYIVLDPDGGQYDTTEYDLNTPIYSKVVYTY